MKISTRLETIYEMIEPGHIVADIGCDHALLPCRLIEGNKCTKVYACDINPNPLKSAAATIKHYNYSDNITLILSDGLKAVPADADCIVIAGMGYETIASIIDEAKERLNPNCQLIVQSNKEVDALRQFISNHRYHIIEERCIYEHHYYQVIKFDLTKDQELTEREIYFGKKMLKDDAYKSMWSHYYHNYQTIIKNIKHDNSRYAELSHLLELINQEKGSWH